MNKKLLTILVIVFLAVSAIGLKSTDVDKEAKKNRENIIVEFDNPVSKEIVKTLARIGGGKVKHDWPEINMISIRDLPVNTKKQISGIMGVKRIYQDEFKYPLYLDESVYLVNSDDVWLEGVTGGGVRVCVVDTGVGPNSNLNVVAEYDFYNNDNDATDDHGHGTHCAGIVASAHNTYKGNAYGVDIMAAKTINANGGGYESDTVDGILWCAKGPDGVYGTGDEADVITISLGFSTHSGACDDQPAASAANTAVDNGVFVVASSGNDCSETVIGNPSCGSKVMSIGSVYDDNVGSKSWCCNWMCSQTCTDSTTYADKISCFSNGNNELDVVAPGSVITSLAPTNIDPDGLDDMSGTSQSGPHVAGLASLLLEEDPTLTPNEIRQIIRNTAVDLGYPFNKQGYGRVDAYAAWQMVSTGTTTTTTIPTTTTITTTTTTINATTTTSTTTTTINATTTTTITTTSSSTTTTIGEICGDGYCAGSANGEDCNTCPEDCISGQGGTCAACWKGVCDGNCHPKKEGPECSDCAESYCCGDGVCEGAETEFNCYVDCFGVTTTTTVETTTTIGQCKPKGPKCNCNGICDARETQKTCPWDCP